MPAHIPETSASARPWYGDPQLRDIAYALLGLITSEERTPAMAFETGTKIRVTIEARARDNAEQGLSGTQEVTETTQPYWMHFLYLNSSQIFQEGNLIRAEFDAEVTGSLKGSLSQTTEVREISGSFGYTHYLYLDSPSITVLPEEVPPPAVPSTRITPFTTTIESADVIKRIAELEGGPAKEVTIRRTSSENLFTTIPFEDQAAARKYLDDRDYNLSRFTIAGGPVQLSLGDQEELDRLRTLNKEGQDVFGPSQWITDSVRLYNDEFFTEGWTKEQAMKKLGVGRYALEEWPLNTLDWGEAATALLESQYTQFEFEYQTFWSPNTA